VGASPRLAATERLRAAQEWPPAILTLVVPFAAGGDDDILARMLAPRLAQSLGQPSMWRTSRAAAA
jgi:tripartite-type tricarboxylate transporter receptor subunit TctC